MDKAIAAQGDFQVLADTLALDAGESFFEDLVMHLAKVLQVEFVLIGEIGPDNLSVHTLAIWSKGEFGPNIDYPLKGTPCDGVVGNQPCHYPSDICARFPDDPMLEELGAESYLGIPIFTPDGSALGLIAVLDSRPMPQADMAREVLRVAASRAGAELTRQQVERRLRTSHRALTLLGRCNKALIRASDEPSLLESICHLAVEAGGYRMASVGYALNDPAKSIVPQAWAGNEQGYYEAIRLSWSETDPYGQGPAGRCIRSGKTVVQNRLRADERFKPWLEDAEKRGFQRIICLPLRREDGTIFGILALYEGQNHPDRSGDHEGDEVDERELALLEELADNLAYGINALRLRLRQQRMHHAVLKIATAVSARSGNAYFDQLAHHMVQALNADAAFVGLLDATQPRQVNSIAAVIDGQSIGDIAYDVSGTPCERVIAEGHWASQGDITVQLPTQYQDSLHGVRAYVGYRLDNANGDPIGLLVVMFRRPLEDAGFVSSVLQIFTAGAATELERQNDESRIMRLAYYDSATNLPNRTYFKEYLEAAFALAAQKDTSLGVLFLDLDRFKDINDSYGHDTGDRVLIAVAERFAKVLPGNCMLARLGGDEFVVVAEHIDNDGMRKLAERLQGVLATPFTVRRQQLSLDVSLGMACYPADADNVGELLKHADMAMYHAKERGSGYCSYDSAMGESVARRLLLAKRLTSALKNDALELHFQAQIDLESDTLVGVEALCRWHDAELGWINPAEFIPLVEERGMAPALGDWVLQAACRQILAWRKQGVSVPSVSINVAAQQLDDPQFVQRITTILATYGVAPSSIGLELTEGGFMKDPEQAIVLMKQLKSAGFTLAVDDFGTGYSSLAYLKSFPLDTLKIDMSFVRNMLSNDNDLAIVATIISMARSLNMRTVAEGVETRGQANTLRELGCDQAQGFYYSRPQSGEAFAADWLLANSLS
ncbi:EAL domain-containing protein [Aidingimonas lacisalsi]|uniref:EAL domain-containing protein n=1 Tax=Aidingimonas lacisalsi TaxID=2604086 RepID=UPI0011D187A4|nr:EAL domain-containing protein [Aidingimonas lacisalsi]